MVPWAKCVCCRGLATGSTRARCRPSASGASLRASAAACPWTCSWKSQWNSRSGEVIMDSALVVITLASLGTTGAVLLYAARLIRDERSRSNARVTALAQEIGHVAAGAGRAPAPIAYAAPAAGIPLGRGQREA